MATLKVPVTTEDHMQGDANAEVVLVEYGDYQCPHCGHAYPIVKRVQKHFGARLAFVFRNFPLQEIHAHAETAAEAAEFAAAHDRFWPMHDAMFENQGSLGLPYVLELAERVGLRGKDLESALAAEAFAPRVRADFKGGVRSGVNGTPTFFINGERHDGPVEFEDLIEAIEAHLR